jgi:hypothetical protein
LIADREFLNGADASINGINQAGQLSLSHNIGIIIGRLSIAHTVRSLINLDGLGRGGGWLRYEISGYLATNHKIAEQWSGTELSPVSFAKA